MSSVPAYGISLRPLALFADETYRGSDAYPAFPQDRGGGEQSKVDVTRAARMHKAIAVIQFKLEGQTIMRNPRSSMDDRFCPTKSTSQAARCGLPRVYPLRDCDFRPLTLPTPTACPKPRPS